MTTDSITLSCTDSVSASSLKQNEAESSGPRLLYWSRVVISGPWRTSTYPPYVDWTVSSEHHLRLFFGAAAMVTIFHLEERNHQSRASYRLTISDFRRRKPGQSTTTGRYATATLL